MHTHKHTLISLLHLLNAHMAVNTCLQQANRETQPYCYCFQNKQAVHHTACVPASGSLYFPVCLLETRDQSYLSDLHQQRKGNVRLNMPLPATAGLPYLLIHPESLVPLVAAVARNHQRVERPDDRPDALQPPGRHNLHSHPGMHCLGSSSGGHGHRPS